MLLAVCAMAAMSIKVEDLGWMSGSWETQKWGGRMEEHWTVPAGGTLLGMNRLVADGKTPHREFIVIETKEGKTTLTVSVLGNKAVPEPVTYDLKSVAPQRAVFANPAHLRLHTMTYFRDGNALVCQIEGIKKEAPYQEEFRFSRF